MAKKKEVMGMEFTTRLPEPITSQSRNLGEEIINKINPIENKVEVKEKSSALLNTDIIIPKKLIKILEKNNLPKLNNNKKTITLSNDMHWKLKEISLKTNVPVNKLLEAILIDFLDKNNLD